LTAYFFTTIPLAAAMAQTRSGCSASAFRRRLAQIE